MSFELLLSTPNSKFRTHNLLFFLPLRRSSLKIMAQQSRGVEHAQDGTRKRVVECRRRLRRVRVVQKTIRLLARDEAVIAATEILALAANETDFADSVEMFEEVGATFSRETLPVNARG